MTENIQPRRSPKKIAATVLALGAATATVVFGSFAAWSASTTNPGNSVASGTLTMTNDKDATAVFTATGAKPGDTGGSTVTVANTGSIPMSVTLTQGAVTNTGFGTDLKLQIHDDTRNSGGGGWCYWPNTGAGACATYAAWDGTATLTGLALANTAGGAQWPAAQSHTFTVNWEFASAAGNGTQGQTATFGLTWAGAQ